MSARGKKTSTVTQGDTMIPGDKTPLVVFEYELVPGTGIILWDTVGIARAVNFLRHGCPSVNSLPNGLLRTVLTATTY